MSKKFLAFGTQISHGLEENCKLFAGMIYRAIFLSVLEGTQNFICGEVLPNRIT